MAKSLFRTEIGVHIVSENAITGVQILFGADAPGGEALTQAAEVGSSYLRTDGSAYIKKTAGSGTDKWVRQATTDDLLEISFRSEKVKAATGDAAPSSPTVIDLAVNPFSDDETPKLVAADFSVDDHIIFGVGGTPKLMRVSLVSGDEITVVDAADALAANDNFVVSNYLPDSPADQEAQALVHYNGSAIIKLGDVNWAFATGINLSSAYSASSGNPSAGDSVEVGIQKVDGNVDAVNSAMGIAQGATNMGEYTGNILTDNQSTKQNIQELSNYSEEILTRTSKSNVTTEDTLDEVLVDTYVGAIWDVWGELAGTPTRKKMLTVNATHNGTASADADATDSVAHSVLRIGADIQLSVNVDLNGVGAAQTMRLRVSAPSAVNVKAIRRVIK